MREIKNEVRDREGDKSKQTSEHDYNKIQIDGNDDDDEVFSDKCSFMKR